MRPEKLVDPEAVKALTDKIRSDPSWDGLVRRHQQTLFDLASFETVLLYVHSFNRVIKDETTSTLDSFLRLFRRALVEEARDGGHTLDEIADALGMSPEECIGRFV